MSEEKKECPYSHPETLFGKVLEGIRGCNAHGSSCSNKVYLVGEVWARCPFLLEYEAKNKLYLPNVGYLHRIEVIKR